MWKINLKRSEGGRRPTERSVFKFLLPRLWVIFTSFWRVNFTPFCWVILPPFTESILPLLIGTFLPQISPFLGALFTPFYWAIFTPFWWVILTPSCWYFLVEMDKFYNSYFFHEDELKGRLKIGCLPLGTKCQVSYAMWHKMGALRGATKIERKWVIESQRYPSDICPCKLLDDEQPAKF